MAISSHQMRVNLSRFGGRVSYGLLGEVAEHMTMRRFGSHTCSKQDWFVGLVAASKDNVEPSLQVRDKVFRVTGLVEQRRSGELELKKDFDEPIGNQRGVRRWRKTVRPLLERHSEERVRPAVCLRAGSQCLNVARDLRLVDI